MSYEAQLAAKVEIVRDCLRRIARISLDDLQIVASPQRWRYRSRVEWQVDAARGGIGYYRRGSHELIEVSNCPVLVSPLEDTLRKLGESFRNEPSRLRSIKSILAAASDDGRISLAPAKIAGLCEEIVRVIAGEHYRFNAECFFQVNTAILEALIDEVLTDVGGKLGLDLYSGVGLFTLPLARRMERVVAVEENHVACQFARRNVAEAGLKNVEIKAARVADWLKSETITGAVDFVLLDPPRAGVEEEAIDRIIALDPMRIAYVGCDPAVMARDVRRLIVGGYRLDRIRLFDMFPQTHHVETVVQLLKSTSGAIVRNRREKSSEAAV